MEPPVWALSAAVRLAPVRLAPFDAETSPEGLAAGAASLAPEAGAVAVRKASPEAATSAAAAMRSGEGRSVRSGGRWEQQAGAALLVAPVAGAASSASTAALPQQPVGRVAVKARGVRVGP